MRLRCKGGGCSHGREMNDLKLIWWGMERVIEMVQMTLKLTEELTPTCRRMGQM